MKVGRYKILSRLGSGAFGVVYRARDPRLDRDVALKLLKPPADEPLSVWKRRIRLEVRAAAGLHHPGIVVIHDVATAKGRPFYTMELIEGPSLSRWLSHHGLIRRPGGKAAKRGPATSRERAGVLPQCIQVLRLVADALGCAHDQGIVHRDIKPDNILVDHRGPHIADFGLARNVAKTPSGAYAGLPIGSPPYMSPEQWLGQATAASDTWALGVMLYEMLTGDMPFPGSTIGEIAAAIMRDSPRRPSAIEPLTPTDLETICLKALQKEATARYATGRDFARALKLYLSNSTARRERPLVPKHVECPRCGAAMVRRHGKFGAFFGCSNYPRCRGTRDLGDVLAP